jgi:hydrogenase maturation protease
MNLRTVVIGIGNPFRRDDGAGPAVVDLLRQRLTGVEFVVCDGEPTTLIDAWTGAARAVVIDAVRCERGDVGHIFRFAAGHPTATRAGVATSHAADLGDTVALARALDRMPDTLLVYTVQVDDVSYGTGLSPAVVAAARRLADVIAADLTGSASEVP